MATVHCLAVLRGRLKASTRSSLCHVHPSQVLNSLARSCSAGATTRSGRRKSRSAAALRTQCTMPRRSITHARSALVTLKHWIRATLPGCTATATIQPSSLRLNHLPALVRRVRLCDPTSPSATFATAFTRSRQLPRAFPRGLKSKSWRERTVHVRVQCE